MGKAYLVTLLVLTACSFPGGGNAGETIAATGGGTSRLFAVTGFTGIDLRGSDNVDVQVGTGFSVRAEGPGQELDRLRIDKVGDTLRIGRKNGRGLDWSGRHDGARIFVTMPRIASASIAGSGDMTIDRVEGEGFAGSSAGSGSLTVATLNVQNTDISVVGSGDVRLSGVAKRLLADVAGSGDVDAAGLKAESAKVSVMGSGNVRAAVNGSAEVSVMGSGDVDLGASAKCTISKMGSGAVRCGG